MKQVEFDKLCTIDRYRKTVGFLRKLHASEDLAEHITQDAWLRGRHLCHQIKDGARVVAWVNTIARNLLYRFLRSERRANAVLVHYRPLSQPVETALIIPVDISRALEACPIHYRQVIEMFYYEGHSVQELEQILNISAGTLYGTLARARCYLRAALVNYTSTNRSSKTNPHRTKVLKPITAENNRASISNTSHQIVAP